MLSLLGQSLFPRTAPALALAIALAFGTTARAQDASVSHQVVLESDSHRPETTALSYRRVFVPADRTDLWPSDGKRFLPIQQDEFTQLLESAKRSQKSMPNCRIDRAIYRASLQDESRLEGEAELAVKHLGGKPAVLPLGDCSLTIHQATWADTGEAAAIGLTAAAGTGLLVDRSAKLSLRWSAGAESDSFSEKRFRLRFPPAASKTLKLTLPKGKEPSVDRGVILGHHDLDEKFIAWQIELGGHSETVLKISTLESSQVPPSPASFTEHTHYSFVARRLDMSTDLVLNPLLVSHEQGSLRFLDFQIDEPLVLVSARSGSAQLNWFYLSTDEMKKEANPDDHATRMKKGNNKARARQIRVEFPKPIVAGQHLTLKAVAPLRPNRTWLLPRITPRNLLWTSGAATLDIPESLVLNWLVARDCHHISTTSRSGASKVESLRFQQLAQSGRIEIQVSDQIDPSKAVAFPGVQQQTAATFELGPREVSGRLAFAIESLDRRMFDLQGEVAPNWTIDSVATLPPDALAEWMLDEEVAKGRQLTIRLAQPITPSHPLRLVVQGTLRHPQMTSKDQAFIQFDYKHASRALVLARPRANSGKNPSRVEVNAKRQPIRINPKSLTSTEQLLLEKPEKGLLFAREPGAQELTIVLANTRPRFTGQIMIDSHLEESTYAQTTTFQCTPKSGSVTSLLIQFAKVSQDSLLAPSAVFQPSWTFYDEKNRPLIARKIAGEKRRQLRLLGEGETWEVSLRQPYDSEFSIYATKTIPRRSKHPIVFAALLNAARQSGEVAIRAHNMAGLRLENTRLSPLPTPTAESRDGQLLGLFQFDPIRETLVATNSPLTIHASLNRVAAPSLIVWRRETTARFAPSGVVDCFLSLEIENQGETHLAINLPKSGLLTNLWRDGQRLTLPEKSSTTGQLAIPLDQNRRFTTIAVFFTVKKSPLSSFGTTTMPHIKIEAPVIEREQIAILPPSYETHSATAAAHNVLSPWTERLFGPLSRSAVDQRFDPFKTSHWIPASLYRPESQPGPALDREHLLNFSEQILRVFATATNSPDASPGSWGSLIQRCIPLASDQFTTATDTEGENAEDSKTYGLGASRLNLFIDRSALVTLGIGPQNAVHQVSVLSSVSGDQAVSGSQQLKGADLVLWSFPKGVLITTAGRTALFRSMLTPTRYRSLFEVFDPSLSDALSQSSQMIGTLDQFNESPILRAEQWIALDSNTASPWPSISSMPIHPPGWNAYRLQPAGKGKSNKIRIVHTGTVRLLGALAFLLASGLASGKLCENLRIYLLVLALASLAALFLPVSLVPILAGLVLGLLTGPILRRGYNHFVRPRLQRVIISKGSTVISPAPAVVLCCLFWSLSITPAIAQDLKANDPSPRINLPQILIPFDARPFGSSDTLPIFAPGSSQVQPSGDDVYVPDDFFRQLHRIAGQTKQGQGLWMITRGDYRARFREPQPSEAMLLDQFEAVFLVETFGRGVNLPIPFSSQGAKWPKSSVRLDGRPANWRSSEDGKSLILLIDEPGTHRISLSPKLAITTTEEGSVFAVSTPRLFSSFLELSGPSGVPAVTVSDQFTTLVQKDSSHPERNPLRPSESLRISWAARDRVAPKSLLTVDELLWMRVGAATTRLAARFHVQAAKNRSGPLLLEADAAWRILAPTHNSIIRRIVPLTALESSDSVRRYRIEMRGPLQNEMNFELQLLLSQKDRVSVFDAPRVSLLASTLRERLLGFTVDSSLQYDAPASVEEGYISPTAFLKSWQSSAPIGALPEALAPTAAFRMVESMPTWNLVTAPLKSFASYSDQTVLSVGHRSATLNYRANFTTRGGPRFQIQLDCPASVAIGSMMFLEGNQEIASRWKRDSNGIVNVFLAQPLKSDVHLEVKATLPVPADGRLKVPFLNLSNCQRTKRRLIVLRQPNSLISVEAPSSNTKLALGEYESLAEGESRLVEVIDLPKTGAEVICRVRSNAPRVQGKQLISMNRSASGWTASSQFTLTIEQGLLDSIQLEIPAWWTGPFEVTPPSSVQILDLTESSSSRAEESGTRRLRIRPDKALHGSVTIKLEAPVALQDGQSVQTPNIRLMNHSMKRRLVALPKRGNSHELAWNTRGLRVVNDGSNHLFSEEFDNKQFDLFEATIPQFQARPRTIENLELVPTIELADLRVLINQDYETRTVATLDLDPGGLGTCDLRLPTGFTLLRVTVAGVPCSAVRLPHGPGSTYTNTWQIPLGPRGLPQRIQIIYTSDDETKTMVGVNELVAPQLLASGVPLKIQHTLWSVYSDVPVASAPTDTPTEPQPFDAQFIRQQAILTLLSTGVERCERLTLPQRANWYRRWTQRLGDPSVFASNTSTGLDEEAVPEKLRLLSAQLGIESELQSLPSRATGMAPAHAVEPGELLVLSYQNLLPCEQRLYTGSAERLAIELEDAHSGNLWSRLRVATIIFFAAVLGYFATRHPFTADHLRRANLTWFIAIGLTWWLWMSPSAFGLLIILVTAITYAWRNGREVAELCSMWFRRYVLRRGI